MKKGIFAIILCALLACPLALTACGNEEVLIYEAAYCYDPYDAGGTYGVFSVAVGDEYYLEEEPGTDKLTLSGAFAGMEIYAAEYSEEEDLTYISLSGKLGAGEYGVVSGKGLVKGESVSVTVPIKEATATSSSVIYDFTGGAVVDVTLGGACFTADFGIDDISLGGAAENMTVTSVTTYAAEDGEGGKVLSNEARIELSGDPNGMDAARITLLPSATTFNREIDCMVQTDFCGGVVLNDHIDTYSGSDVVYISAHNVTFTGTGGITLGGALGDYAEIASAEVVSPELVVIELSFPYTLLSDEGGAGYIEFPASTNEEGIEFFCAAVVAAPDVEYTHSQSGSDFTVDITLLHDTFGSPTSGDVTFIDCDTFSELSVSGVTLEKSADGRTLTLTFTLPESYTGSLIMFRIDGAYGDSAESLVSVAGELYVTYPQPEPVG